MITSLVAKLLLRRRCDAAKLMSKCPSFSTSSTCRDLMEFFDAKENWGQAEVKSGRSWRTEELRMKSNADLHKLWYVLLKERNMLLTTEHAAKETDQVMPNAERIDRVDETMERLEQVVRERNEAYFELEYGESGERPHLMVTTFMGFRVKRYLDEHIEPRHMHEWKSEAEKHWKPYYEQPYLDADAYLFQKMYREKLEIEARDKEDDEKRERDEHKRIHQW